MRIFLDANILFSASGPASATRVIFDAAVAQGNECITNPHALEEARRNIEYKRPAQTAGFNELLKHVRVSHAFSTAFAVDLPPGDVPVLAGAVGARCTHLWTGDKRHFGQWYGKTIHDVLILSHLMLADILLETGWKP